MGTGVLVGMLSDLSPARTACVESLPVCCSSLSLKIDDWLMDEIGAAYAGVPTPKKVIKILSNSRRRLMLPLLS